MKPATTNDEDRRELVKMIDHALSALAQHRTPLSRAVLVFEHGPDENPLQEVFDYLESRGATVENVFTMPRPMTQTISREVLIKVRGYVVWDGTVGEEETAC